MRQHPGTANARYLAPPVTVVACAAGLAAAPFTAWALVVPAGYGVGIVAASAHIGRGLPLRSRLALPAVLGTMHWAWGLGFLTSPRALADRRPRPAEVPAVDDVVDGSPLDVAPADGAPADDAPGA
jgi:hypothetical protein